MDMTTNTDKRMAFLDQSIEHLNRYVPDQKHCRSYKSLKGLDEALARHGLSGERHVTYTFDDGRVTAMFLGSNANRVIFIGFPWIACG